LRFLLQLALMLVIALTVGFGLSWYALTDGRLMGAMSIGPWTAWRNIGSPAPDPYTRAVIARSGMLELGTSEGVRFIARTDSDSRPLDRTCRYRIEGPTPSARFWTLAPIDAETGASVARADGPLELQSGRLSRRSDGIAVLYVSPLLAPQNWLEIGGEGAFELVLTFYDTAGAAGLGSEISALPAIRREACA